MSKARFLKMINDNPITPIEMESYLQALEKQDDQSFETQTFVGCDIFPDSKGKRFSISMRLHALARILESEDLPGWVKPTDEEGIIRVAENIYIAAGLEDMVEVDNYIVLDKGKLLKKAFQLNVI